MGWTFGPRQRGISTKDYFAREFDGPGGRVVDAAVDGSTVYLAYEKRLDGKDVRYAIVCLTRRRKGEFGYKDMDEGMGPLEANCPLRILSQLSPVEEVFEGMAADWARAWRKRAYQQPRLQNRLLYGLLRNGSRA